MNTKSVLTRMQCSLVLGILMLIDIGPIPITALISLYIVFFRPRWFKKLIDSIYGDR